MGRWKTWTAEQFQQHPVIAWVVLFGGAMIGLAAVLSAVGVIGDWGRWAAGRENPEIVEFTGNDTWDDPSYYVVIQNRSGEQVRLFAVEYEASQMRPPGRGEMQPTAALLAEHEYRIPLVCNASRRVELDPNFVVEAGKSEGFRLTLLAPSQQRGRGCEIKLRFDSSGGATDWHGFRAFFHLQHKPCKIVHVPSGKLSLSQLKSAMAGGDCVQIAP